MQVPFLKKDWQPAERITVFAMWVLGGFLVSIVFHYIRSAHAGYDHYPYTTFLCRKPIEFSDFFGPLDLAKSGTHPYANPLGVGYGPFLMLLFQIFAKMPKWLGAYCMLIAFYFSLSKYAWSWLKRFQPEVGGLPLTLSISVLIAFAYPNLFVVDRMNVEMISFAFTACFFYFFLSKRFDASAVALAFAVNIKIYYLAFLFLLIAERKNRSVMICAATTIIIMLLSYQTLAIIFHTHLSEMIVSHWRQYLLYGKPQDSSRTQLIQHNHTFWAGIEGLVTLHDLPAMDRVSAIYSPLAAAGILFILSVAGFAKRLLLWQRITLIAISMTFLIPISFDYTLIIWSFPVFAFLGSADASEINNWYTILMASLFIPMDYAYIKDDASISIWVYSLIGGLVLFFILMELARLNYAPAERKA